MVLGISDSQGPSPTMYSTDYKEHTMDFTDMTDEDLYTLIDDAQTELGRRQTAEAFEQQVNELYESARASGAIKAPEQGEQWKQPLGAHDAYAKGDVVTHDGVQWVSTVTPNTWRPGASGWHRKPEDDPETGEPVILEWVRPVALMMLMH